MALKDTAKKMNELLESIQQDLAKADKGNKAAAQRVRTDSIKLEKIAKVYRKESIKAEKSGLMKRNKVAAKNAKLKAARAKSPAKKATRCAATKCRVQTKAKTKAPAKKVSARGKVKKVTKPRTARK